MKKMIFVPVLLIFSYVFLFWATPTLYSAYDAMIGYGTGSNAAPSYRTLDTNASTWSSPSAATSMGATIQHVVLKACPIRDERVLGVLRGVAAGSNKIFIATWTVAGGWATASLSIAPNITDINDDFRGFDIAYENSSGDALVCYQNNVGDTIFYRTWNGSAWSAETSTATLPTTDTLIPVWIRMASKPNSDEIALIYLASDGSSHQVGALIWNGTTWVSQITLETAAADNDYDAIAVEYMQQSGKSMFCWDADSTMESRIWNGTSWESELPAVEIGGAVAEIRWMHLKCNTTDQLMLVTIDLGNDVNTLRWSGTAWDASPVEHTASGEGSIFPYADVIWETTSGHGTHCLLVWGDGATVSWKHWNGSAWSAATVIGGSDDTAVVRLDRLINGNIWLSLYDCDVAKLDIEVSSWTVSTQTWGTIVTIETDPSVTAEPYMRPFCLSPTLTTNATPNPPSALAQYGPNWETWTVGEWKTYTQIRTTFTLTDPDSADTVRFNVQFSTYPNFSYNYISFTSALIGTTPQTTNYITPLLPDGTWYWRVRCGDNGELWSSYSSFTVVNDSHFRMDVTPPPIPSAPSVSLITGAVGFDISWSLVTDACSGTKDYLIYRATFVYTSTSTANVEYVATILHSGATHQDTSGIVENTTYYYSIIARDNLNNASGQSELTAKQWKDAISPSAISNLTAIVGTIDGQVSLAWTAPGDDGTSGNVDDGLLRIKASTYSITGANFDSITNNPRLTYSIDISTSYTTQMSEHGYTMTGLNPGTTYYFAIKLKDSAGMWSIWPGTSTIINSASFAPAHDLPPPTVNDLSATASYRKITLTWTEPTLPEFYTPDIDYYRFYRDSTTPYDFADAHTFNIDTGNASYIDSGLTTGVAYYYKMRVVDEGDTGNGLFSPVLESAFSNEVNAMPPSAPYEGFVAYFSSNSAVTDDWRYPEYETYDESKSVWSTIESSAIITVTENDGRSGSGYYVVRTAPWHARQFERVVGVQDSTGCIKLQVYSLDEGWKAFHPVSNVPDTIVGGQFYPSRMFDITYEQISGNAMVVARSSGSSTLPKYYRWNGTSWYEQGNLPAGMNTGAIKFIRLEANPKSNEIICVVQSYGSDGDTKVSACVWNGTTLTWGTTIFLETDASHHAIQAMDVAYEWLSGRALVGWELGGAGELCQYRIWDGSGWSAEYQFTPWAGPPVAGGLRNMRMTGIINTNTIIYSCIALPTIAAADIYAVVWNGSSWGNNRKLSDDCNETADYPDWRPFDVAYERETSTAVFVYGDVGAWGTPYVQRYKDGVWTVGPNANSVGTNAIRWVICEPNLGSDSNDVHLMTIDSLGVIKTQKWNGSVWSSPVTLELNSKPHYAAGPTEQAGFSYLRPDLYPPSAISSLTAFQVYPVGSSGTIRLQWTNTGDDGNSGNFLFGSEYRIQYSTWTSGFNWSKDSAQITLSAEGHNALSIQSTTTSGLTQETTYYFKIWVCDEMPNWSDASPVVSTIAVIAPSAITSFSGTVVAGGGCESGFVLLKWTSPGDDGTTGNLIAGSRFYISSTTLLSNATNTAFWTARGTTTLADVKISTENVTPRSTQSWNLQNLKLNTAYYFRVWTRDENSIGWSALSVGATVYVTIAASEERTISGNVREAGTNNPLQNISVILTGTRTRLATTGADGSYSFTLPACQEYIVMPSSSSMYFSTTTAGVSSDFTDRYYYSSLPVNRTNQDFAGYASYGNLYYSTSTTTTMDISDNTKKASMRWTAQETRSYATARIYISATSGSDPYVFEVRTNDDSGHPSDVIVSSNTADISKDNAGWKSATLNNIPLTKGTTYHLVIYTTAPAVASALSIRVGYPIVCRYPLDSSPDPAANVINYGFGDNPSSWKVRNAQPVYVFTVGANGPPEEGVPYSIISTGDGYQIAGSTWVGQQFWIEKSSFAAKEIQFLLKKRGTPSDNCYYQVRGPGDFSNMLASGTLTTPTDAPSVESWVIAKQDIACPPMLYPNSTYWVMLMSPGSAGGTSDSYYLQVLNTDDVDYANRLTYRGTGISSGSVFARYISGANAFLVTDAARDSLFRIRASIIINEGPKPVTDLAGTLPTDQEGAIKLDWTFPGVCYTYPLPENSLYRIQHTSVAANAVNTTWWDKERADGTVVNINITTGLVAVSEKQTRIVTGLAENVTYYFRLWSRYGTLDYWSPISNAATCYATPILPSAITSLSALPGVWGRSVGLSWIAPGDDAWSNNIIDGKFRIRWSTYVLTDAEWSNGTWNNYQNKYSVDIDTGTAGEPVIPLSKHGRAITSLRDGVIYYFRIWTRDENPAGWSLGLSNGATSYTTPVVLSIKLVEPATYYNFGEMATGISTVSVSGIIARNDGNVLQTYSLKIDTATTPVWWPRSSAGGGNNEYTLYGIFKDTQPPSGSFGTSAGNDILISTGGVTCTTANYSDGTQPDSDGVGVSPYVINSLLSDTTIWFKFDSPPATSTSQQQTIPVVITATESD